MFDRKDEDSRNAVFAPDGVIRSMFDDLSGDAIRAFVDEDAARICDFLSQEVIVAILRGDDGDDDNAERGWRARRV